MLTVIPPEEALAILLRTFPPLEGRETLPLASALFRVLAADVIAGEYVPGFSRSTVDGYAVRAADTFGASPSLPALLTLDGEIAMGEGPGRPLESGFCRAVPTGGALPAGADAAVMLEHAERYGADTLGVERPAAPGENVVFKGDDMAPGKRALHAGRALTPWDIGALAALGTTAVTVVKRPLVGILSTGDELVAPEQTPIYGQVRDANGSLLAALAESCGCEARRYGIVPDEEAALTGTLAGAAEECDCVLLSGGSSAGARDVACNAVAALGEVLFHGLAMKPGKPTLAGRVHGKPVLGLPGHPAAAAMVGSVLVRPLLNRLLGKAPGERGITAFLTENVPANHGRAQYMGVTLRREGDTLCAVPIHGKSGLITALAGTDGYFCIPRNREGAAKGEAVTVYPY